MKRRYENVSPAVELAIDAVVGTIVMLIAHFAFGWEWGWAALLGYGGTVALVFILCHEPEYSGSSSGSGSSWLDNIF